MPKFVTPPEEVNWEELIEMDKKYFLRPISTAKEYSPLPIARTEGAYLITSENVKILDFMSVLHCANAGAYHPKIAQAIKEYADHFGYLYEGGFLEQMRPKVCKFLIEEAFKGDMARVGFGNSGSEAVEYALMIARVYTGKPYVVTRWYDYHGWTAGAVANTIIPYLRDLAITPTKPGEKPEIRTPVGGIVPYTAVAPPPHCYRCPLGQTYPDCKDRKGMLACINILKELILAHQPYVAAVITEIVQGSCGVFAPPPEYNPQLRQITKELGVLWIDDEVICGFGRTGPWFGYQNWDIKPDIVTFAKGVTSSHIPVGGVAISPELSKWFDERKWWHASTFASHPLGMAAAYATLTVYKEEKLIPDHAKKIGKRLEEGLKGLQERHKSVGNVSGMGLIWGIELVKNKETKEPIFPQDRFYFWHEEGVKIPSKVVAVKCIERRLLVSTFAANNITLMPPLVVTEDEVDRAIDVLDKAIEEVDKII